MLRVSILLAVLFLSGVAKAAPEPSLFSTGEHCVAYKAAQKQFFIKNTPVVGKSCEISSQVIPEPGAKYVFEIRIPIHTFRSGDTKRDEEVARILKSQNQSELIFKSQAMTLPEWKALAEKSVIDFKGELTIGDKSFPITTQARKITQGDDFEFDGVIKTKLSSFEIEPPKMVGGVVATVKDEIELHFHIVGSRTLGLDTLL